MDDKDQENNPENPDENNQEEQSQQQEVELEKPSVSPETPESEKPATTDLGLNEFEDHPRSAGTENFDPFEANSFMNGGHPGEMSAVYNVPVQVSAVLGKAVMPVSQLLKLGRGAVVELDRRVGEAIEIYVNNRLVARGEVVVVDDRLGITMTEIIKAER